MNTYHLKYFVDAVRLGGVGASAELNLVTHSAVSQAIRTLEADLGKDLLIHEKRRFNVTEEGKKIFDWGLGWLYSLDQLREEVISSSGEIAGELRVVAPQSLVREAFWRQIVKFKKKYPKVSLKIHLAIAEGVREHVAKGKSDLGLMIDDHETSSFEKLILSSGYFRLIANEPKPDLFEKELLITNRKKFEVQHFLDCMRRQYGKLPKIGFEVASWGLIGNFVKDAGYVGVVPEYAVADELRRKKLYPVKFQFADPSYDICAIWLGSRGLSRRSQAFLKMMNESD